jgi:hypothetical protein
MLSFRFAEGLFLGVRIFNIKNGGGLAHGSKVRSVWLTGKVLERHSGGKRWPA